MNVQVIMEALGGGGHQTMAGAQIPGISPEAAKEKLFAAIDDYYEKAAGHADE
jgi:c-di-AMP phosphodiesterase-like protein